ncbi:hypothetical protein WJX82_000212 [Trebouxia sp. C0006]
MSKLWHRVKTYIKYDFREIVNPTSLPNPPDYVPPRKLTWGEILKAIQGANRRYVDSWRASAEDEEELRRMTKAASETSLKDELSHTANAAMQKGQGLRPLLHHIYETRARSYGDAIQEFIEGYKEGYVGQATVQSDKLKDVDNLTKPTKPDATNADSKAVSTKA